MANDRFSAGKPRGGGAGRGRPGGRDGASGYGRDGAAGRGGSRGGYRGDGHRGSAGGSRDGAGRGYGRAGGQDGGRDSFRDGGRRFERDGARGGSREGGHRGGRDGFRDGERRFARPERDFRGDARSGSRDERGDRLGSGDGERRFVRRDGDDRGGRRFGGEGKRFGAGRDERRTSRRDGDFRGERGFARDGERKFEDRGERFNREDRPARGGEGRGGFRGGERGRFGGRGRFERDGEHRFERRDGDGRDERRFNRDDNRKFTRGDRDSGRFSRDDERKFGNDEDQQFTSRDDRGADAQQDHAESNEQQQNRHERGSDRGGFRGERTERSERSGGERRERGGFNRDRKPVRRDRDANFPQKPRGGERRHAARAGANRAKTPEQLLQEQFRPVRDKHQDPELPDDILMTDLAPRARNELKSLDKRHAEQVGRHLAAVSVFIEHDPELAHQHALSASRRAGRIPVTREFLALTAYRTGDFALALRELRTHRRLTGRNDHLALLIDSERGMQRQEKAVQAAEEVDFETLTTEQRVYATIALSGAKLDLGQTADALAALEIPELNPNKAFTYSPELFRAYAAVLEDLGRDADAREWERHAARAENALQEAYGDSDELDVFEVIEDDSLVEDLSDESANDYHSNAEVVDGADGAAPENTIGDAPDATGAGVSSHASDADPETAVSDASDVEVNSAEVDADNSAEAAKAEGA